MFDYTVILLVYILGIETTRMSKFLHRQYITYKADKFYNKAKELYSEAAASNLTSQYKTALKHELNKPDESTPQRDNILNQKGEPWLKNQSRVRTR